MIQTGWDSTNITAESAAPAIIAMKSRPNTTLLPSAHLPIGMRGPHFAWMFHRNSTVTNGKEFQIFFKQLWAELGLGYQALVNETLPMTRLDLRSGLGRLAGMRRHRRDRAAACGARGRDAGKGGPKQKADYAAKRVGENRRSDGKTKDQGRRARNETRHSRDHKKPCQHGLFSPRHPFWMPLTTCCAPDMAKLGQGCDDSAARTTKARQE
jgi:hypothetical protein